MTDEPELIVRRDGALGRLTLNRPQAMGALTTAMCEGMIAALRHWRTDDAVRAVLIDHAGQRGFCAGGDIRALAKSAAGDGLAARAFFRTEYQLDHLIFASPKPVITVMDGTVMGGGVGVSLPATHRIATARTRLAMPETGIGLFPDVGAGWFLPRLPGRVGLWMGLTGVRLAPSDCLALGLATHLFASERLPEFKSALAEDPDQADAILERFVIDAGPAPIDELRPRIDRLFAGASVGQITDTLAADGSASAQGQLAILRAKSPLSLKVAFRLIAGSPAPNSFAEDLAAEYRLAAHLVLRHDFREGVRAVIVDKDNAPAWRPARLADVGEDLVDEMFAPLADEAEWTPAPGSDA